VIYSHDTNAMHEIILPDTKPALEWVNNRVLQKVTPRRKHALAQGVFTAALDAWSRHRKSGMAGTEWHFQVQPPGEISRTLVPDVAYLSYDRLPRHEMEVTEIPRIAPDAVVEVRSPEDLERDIAEKTRVYLAAGTEVVFLVDPEKRTVTVVDTHGATVLGEDRAVHHRMLPGFNLPARTLFQLP
jgi:Uma2 family endonuclease